MYIHKLHLNLRFLRHDQQMRCDFLKDPAAIAARYKLNPQESAALATMTDESIDSLRSLKPHPLVDAGAHPLGMLMSLITVQAEARRVRAEAKAS